MDFSFFEEVEDISPEAQKENELFMLQEIARKIGCYNWNYDNENVPDNGEHVGFITQDLLKVPGLADAVHTDENGIQVFDSRYISAAALALVAALARIVLKEKYEGASE